MDRNHRIAKTLRLVLLTLLLTVAMSALLTASADTLVSSWTEGEWTYNKLEDSDGRYYTEIVGYSGTDTVLTIPSDAISIGEGVFENNTSLTRVELPTYLEFIRANAFKGCTALQDLQLNTYLNEIDDSAFEGCTSLAGITLHPYLTRVGANAFRDCSALTSLEMENSTEVDTWTKYAVLTEIGEGAFENCPIEGEIVIPTSVKIIGADAFLGCSSVTQVMFADYLAITPTSTGGVNQSFHSPELESIGANAFKDCVSLEAIDIPYRVTTLGAGAFEGCSALSEATLKNGRISQIPDRLFKDTALRKIVLPNVNEIGVDAFAGCDALETVYKPDGVQYAFSPDVSVFSYGEYIRPDIGQLGVAITAYEGPAEYLTVDAQVFYQTLAIGAEAFKGNTVLRHIDLPDDLYLIGDNAFEDCTALTEIEIPSSVKSLGTMLFGGCDSLETITLLCENSAAEGPIFAGDSTVCYAKPLCATVQNLGDAAGDFRFTDLDDHDWVYRQLSAATAETLGYGAQPRLMACQYNGTALAELSVLEGVNILGERLFYNHQELTSVDLPETLVYIDAEAFSHAEALQAAVIPEGVTHIGYKAFEYCINVSSVSLPDSLKELGDYTFTNCTRVRDIELPDNMERVGVNVLGEADVAGARTFKVNLSSHTATLLGSYSFFYDKENPDYRYRWYNWFDDDHGHYIQQYSGGLFLNKYLGSEERITISDQVVGIDKYAFCMLNSSGSVQSYNTMLKEITFPSSVKVIGQSALRQASALEKVVFEGPLTVVCQYAFSTAPRLETVEFHGAVDLIDNSSFENCDSLTSLTFDGGVEKIGNSAFADCDALESVILSEGTLSIGASAFKKCERLTHVVLPDSVTGIGSNAFFRSPVEEVTLKDTGVTVGSRAFSLPTRVYCALESDTAHRLSDSLCLFAPNQLDAAHANLTDTMLRYVREYETGVEELRFYYYFGSEPFIRLYDHIDSLAGRSYSDDPYYQAGYNNYYTGGFNPYNSAWGLSDQEMAAGHLNGARILAAKGSAMAKMISASRYGFTPDQASDYDYSYVGDDLYIFKAYLPGGGDVLTITELPEDVSGVWEKSFGASDGYGISQDMRFECSLGSTMAVAVSKGYAFEDPDSPMLWLRYSTDGAKCAAVKCAQGAVDVVIPDGVTDIGDESFMGEWVYDYDDVNCIDNSYVESNTVLKSVYLPESVTHIGYQAFRACTELEAINTERVQSVSDFAFRECCSLQTVDLRQLQSLGQGMFYGATVQDLYLSSAYDGFSFTVSDDEYMDPNNDPWIYHPLGSTVNLHLEEGITSLGPNALYCVRNCYMPRSLVAIDDNNWPSVHAYSDSYAAKWASEHTGRFIPIPDEGWDLKWQDEKLYVAGYHGEDEFIYGLPADVEGILPGATFKDVKFIAPDPDSDFAHMVEAFYTSETSGLRLAWNGDSLEMLAYEDGDTDVVVPEGVTKIPDAFFKQCSGLTAITLPEGMTEIGAEAFRECTSLEEITLPESVTGIGGRAFRGCTTLATVTIPASASLSEIGEEAFYGCAALEEIALPDSVTTIGDRAFRACSGLTAVTLSAASKLTQIGVGVFYDCAELTEIALPDSVTEISDYMFYDCGKLTAVNLTPTSGLTRIGDYAFYGCNLLSEITLPAGVTEISQNHCLPGAVMIPSDSPAAKCYSQNVGPFVPASDPNWFLQWEDDTLYIAGYRGEGNCIYSLPADTTMWMHGCNPDDYKFIAPDADSDFAHSVSAFYTSEDTPFRLAWKDDALELVAFESSNGEVTVPDGVTRIGSRAFDGQSLMQKLTLPTSVTEIGDYAFNNCNSLMSLRIPEGTQLAGIGAQAFQYCYSLHEITLPASLTEIGEQSTWPDTVYAPSDSCAARWQSEHFGSFVPVSNTDWALKWQDDALYIAGYRGASGCIYGWPEDTQIVLPGVDLEGYRFIASDVDSVFAHSVTAFYTSEDSSLRLGWDGDALVLLAHEKTETEVTVPEGVTRIAEKVFTNDASLCIVNLPDSVTEIGDRAFDMCTSLNTVNLSASSALTRVGDNAFNYCGLRGITLPDGVTTIGDYAFYNCSSLSSINMPESLEEIGDYAFSGCQPLTAPALPEGLKRIGSHAFCTGGAGWVDFGTLVLPESLESLGSDVIDVGELTLPDNLTQIEGQCVELYVNVESVTAGNLPADTVFRDRTDGNAYTKQDDGIYLTRWSNRSDIPFAMSGAVKGLLINGSEAVIGNTGFTSIALPAGITEFRRNGEANCAFIENNDQLTTLSIPEGVTSLPERTAWNNPNLIYLELPESLTAIDPEAFDGGINIVLGHVGTYAQTYADDNSLLFIDIDDPDSIADSVTIVPVVTSLYAGDEISLSDLVRVMPEIGGNLSLSAESVTPNTVSVKGTTVRALKGGSARLYVMVEDHDLTEVPVDLTVYNPVEDFTVPETVYVKVNASAYVSCENIVPAEWTDGRFEWNLDRYGTAADCSGVDIYPTQRGTVQATVTSSSGITKGFKIMAYNNMGNITVSADNDTMIVHESRPVTVKIALDSVAYTNPTGLYTLESSDPGVVRIIDNDRILAVGEGTATINATTVNGSSARKPLTITVASAESATLSLPAATGYIEEEAFAGIPAVRIVIPGDRLTIGSRAFADSSVKVVVFSATGDMDVQIADDAFDGCGSVTLFAQQYLPQLAEYAAYHDCLLITADGGIYTAPQ